MTGHPKGRPQSRGQSSLCRVALLAATSVGWTLSCSASEDTTGTTSHTAGAAGTMAVAASGASGSESTQGGGGSGGDALSVAGNAGVSNEAGGGQGGVPIAPPGPPDWQTRQLTGEFWAEHADVADMNLDGIDDIVAGPLILLGPDYEQRVTILDMDAGYELLSFTPFYFTFIDDLNGDGWMDLISVGIPGTDGEWYENPGAAAFEPGANIVWTRRNVVSGLGNEAPYFIDLVGDAEKEIVYMHDSGLLLYAQRTANSDEPWTTHTIGENGAFGRYTHGLGVGDLDGDERLDVIEATGYWLARGDTAQPTWERHPFDFSMGGDGGAQMLLIDVDGDDDPDIVTSVGAHQYGLYWFENDGDTFTPHELLPREAGPDNFSQLHALGAADFDRDGITDFVTGKRYYGHNGGDPGADDPALLVWFEGTRDPAGFIRHDIHADSGTGVQVLTQDLTGNGKADILTASKKGVFLHTQR